MLPVLQELRFSAHRMSCEERGIVKKEGFTARLFSMQQFHEKYLVAGMNMNINGHCSKHAVLSDILTREDSTRFATDALDFKHDLAEQASRSDT